MSTVDLNSVRKSYGSLEVIHGISMHIPDGQFVALVGPSGCGKSTLLRMVAGLEDISGGEIMIGDRWSMTSRRRIGTSPWCSKTTRSIPT